MKKQTPFLDYYNECIKTGLIKQGPFGYNGLCSDFNTNKTFRLFEPSLENVLELEKTNTSRAFWASGLSMDDHNKKSEFTKLRQVIILLCAAIDGELD